MSQLVKIVKMVERDEQRGLRCFLLYSHISEEATPTLPKRCARLNVRIVKGKKHKRSTSFMIITRCWRSGKEREWRGKERL